MTDKQRVLRFVNTIIPDDFVCGHISMTFDDDGSAFISIGNPEMDEKNTVDKHEDNPKIVRCKNCIHYRYYGLANEPVSECTIGHCENPDITFFCADGEKKE